MKSLPILIRVGKYFKKWCFTCGIKFRSGTLRGVGIVLSYNMAAAPYLLFNFVVSKLTYVLEI